MRKCPFGWLRTTASLPGAMAASLENSAQEETLQQLLTKADSDVIAFGRVTAFMADTDSEFCFSFTCFGVSVVHSRGKEPE